MILIIWLKDSNGYIPFCLTSILFDLEDFIMPGKKYCSECSKAKDKDASKNTEITHGKISEITKQQ
jgi:hypothetical protein